MDLVLFCDINTTWSDTCHSLVLVTTAGNALEDITLCIVSSRFGQQLKLDARYLGGLCEREGKETTNDSWWEHLAVTGMVAGSTPWCAADGDDRFSQSDR